MEEIGLDSAWNTVNRMQLYPRKGETTYFKLATYRMTS